MCNIKVNPNCTYEFLVHTFSIKRLKISENQLRKKVKRYLEEKHFVCSIKFFLYFFFILYTRNGPIDVSMYP